MYNQKIEEKEKKKKTDSEKKKPIRLSLNGDVCEKKNNTTVTTIEFKVERKKKSLCEKIKMYQRSKIDLKVGFCLFFFFFFIFFLIKKIKKKKKKKKFYFCF